MKYLPTSPMQPSQVPANHNSEPSNTKSSVPQAEIGKILLARSAAGPGHITEYGPGIKNLMATPHSPYTRLTVNIVLLGQNWQKVTTWGVFYNFFPFSTVEKIPRRPKKIPKRPAILLARATRKKQNTVRTVISHSFHFASATESAETRSLQNTAVWPVY